MWLQLLNRSALRSKQMTRLRSPFSKYNFIHNNVFVNNINHMNISIYDLHGVWEKASYRMEECTCVWLLEHIMLCVATDLLRCYITYYEKSLPTHADSPQ